MRKKTVWNNEIHGIQCEFQNWGFTEDKADKWNYYIYLTEKNTNAELWAKLLEMKPAKYSIEYFDSWIADLNWHGGITYAEFERNSMQEIVCVKAGCDYSHCFDEGNEYTLDDLVRDCTATIESIPRSIG